MNCQNVSLPNGASAIVCGTVRRERCRCGQRGTLLCDWKMPERRSGTCDAPMCAKCATSAGPNKDICPDHASAFHAWRERQQRIGKSPHAQ